MRRPPPRPQKGRPARFECSRLERSHFSRPDPPDRKEDLAFELVPNNIAESRCLENPSNWSFTFRHEVDGEEGRDDGTPPIPEAPLLGDREQQVLALLANGKRSIEIAAALRISVGTVEVHRRNIMRKLDLHSVAELTRYAIQQGLTPL